MSAGWAGAAGERPTYRRALRHREFAGLYVARVLSDCGDQIARVSIAALVLHRSNSALFAALAFAVSFIPTVLGQAVLGPLADRYPRRTVMVWCDVLRAIGLVVLVLAVVQDSNVWVLLGLLLLVELVGAPFFAASRALLADIFDERPLYLRAGSLMQLSFQLNQVVGVAIGGLAVTALGADRALWLDAATFLVSAVLLLVLVKGRPAAGRAGDGLHGWLDDLRDGLRYVRGDAPTRSLVLLAWLILIAVVAPEAVSLPYASQHGGSTAAGAALLAAGPMGAVLGVLVVGRWRPAVQVARILPMATLLPLPLLAVVVNPPVAVAFVIFMAAGSLQAFLVPLMGTFTLLSPDALRGRMSAVAGSGFAAVSALCWVAVGALADATSPALAVVLAAALVLVLLVPTWRLWPREELTAATARAYS